MEHVAADVEAEFFEGGFEVEFGVFFAGFVEFVEDGVGSVYVGEVVFVVVEFELFFADVWAEGVVVVGEFG